jgi:hypothetical protein
MNTKHKRPRPLDTGEKLIGTGFCINHQNPSYTQPQPVLLVETAGYPARFAVLDHDGLLLHCGPASRPLIRFLQLFGEFKLRAVPSDNPVAVPQ